MAGWKDSNQVEDVGFTRQILDIVQSALSLGGKTKRTFIQMIPSKEQEQWKSENKNSPELKNLGAMEWSRGKIWCYVQQYEQIFLELLGLIW